MGRKGSVAVSASSVTPAPAAALPGAPDLQVSWTQRAVTLVVIVGPFVAGGVALRALRAPRLHDLVLGVILYVASTGGVTMGYHRMYTHKGFVAVRPLRIALAAAGCLAFQGSPEAWVANHRLHHALSDQPGDPHSPYAPADPEGIRESRITWRGLVRSHLGWLFVTPGASVERWAPDMRDDPALRWVSRRYPLICAGGFALPFLVGLAFTGSPSGGLWCAVWAGAVRVGLLHHVSWSINSVCHTFGRRPFPSDDRSSNVWWLSLLSLGESWHNGHHAFPACARHGILPGQVDPTAGAIRLCERVGWVTNVRWPTERMKAKAR